MNDTWIYSVGGQQHGPVRTERLAELAAAGHLRPTTLVWRVGTQGWTPAGEVTELASLPFAEAPPKKARTLWQRLNAPLVSTESPAGAFVSGGLVGLFRNTGMGTGKAIGAVLGLIVLGVFFVLLIRPQVPTATDNSVPNGGRGFAPTQRLTPEQVKARVTFGMSAEQVKRALGDPEQRQEANVPGETNEFWY